MTESGFGLAHIKGEGWPMHSDDLAGDITDAMYERQLRAYIAKAGAQAFTEGCVRDVILQRLKMEMRQLRGRGKMRPITITTIPAGQPHRHGLPDVDDYYYGPDGELKVVVTECGDPRDTMLIAIHAVVEAIINEHLGVTPEMVDVFDAGVPLGDDSPGDKPECPYFLSHQAAKIAEEAAGMVFKRVFKSVRKKAIDA